MTEADYPQFYPKDAKSRDGYAECSRFTNLTASNATTECDNYTYIYQKGKRLISFMVVLRICSFRLSVSLSI